MNRAGKTRKAGAERGQAAVLAAMVLFTMVVFVAMATNVGTLVSDRIRMQGVADVSAYAGAIEQARMMNLLAQNSKTMYENAKRMRALVTLAFSPIRAWPNPDCSNSSAKVPEKLLEAYEKLTTAHHAAMVAVSRIGQKTAVMAAQATAQQNMTGLGFGRSFENFRAYPNSPTFTPKGVLETAFDPDMLPDGVAPELAPVALEFNYAFLVRCKCKFRCCLQIACVKTGPTHVVNTWWYKLDPSATVFFPIRLQGTPLKRFFDIPGRRGYFGAAGRKNGTRDDRIEVYSIAKPFEGNIGARDRSQFHRRKSVRVFLGKSASLYVPEYLDGIENEFRSTYRVRIAGAHENLGSNGLNGAPKIATPGELFTKDPRNLSEEEFDKLLH